MSDLLEQAEDLELELELALAAGSAVRDIAGLMAGPLEQSLKSAQATLAGVSRCTNRMTSREPAIRNYWAASLAKRCATMRRIIGAIRTQTAEIAQRVPMGKILLKRARDARESLRDHAGESERVRRAVICDLLGIALHAAGDALALGLPERRELEQIAAEARAEATKISQRLDSLGVPRVIAA